MATGETVKTLRQRIGLTQEELGERVGVTKAFICQIENDDRSPTIKVAKRIADVLGCTVDTLAK